MSGTPLICHPIRLLVFVVFLLVGLGTTSAADGEAHAPQRKALTDDAVLGNVDFLQGADATERERLPTANSSSPANMWNMDAIRERPLDVEVVSTKTENGYKAEGLYITSQITPEGPDRVFFYLARPEDPVSLAPVFISLTGGGNDEGFVLWAAQSLKCAVVDIEWRRPGAQHRSKWASENRSVWPITSSPTDNFGYNLVIGIRRVIDFLERQPGIDAERIACGGGSMGGYYSLFVAGVDPRVGCVADTYGAGVGSNSEMRSAGARGLVEHLGPAQRKVWMAAYDPASYAARTKASVFMYLAANDFFFWLGDAVRNYDALAGDKRLLIVPNFNHNYGSFGVDSPENPWRMWFLSCLHGGEPLPEVSQPEADGRGYTWTAAGTHAVTESTLYWSPGNVSWPSRYWLAIAATERAGLWRAEIPEEFAGMTAKVYVTVVDKKNRAVSSTPSSREGLDPRTSAGRLWPGEALWDEDRGAGAWRPTAVMVNAGPANILVQTTAPGSLKVGPGEGQQKFALLTNSVVLASGNAANYKGIRLAIDGEGQAGQLKVAFQKESGCPDVTEYATTVDYGDQRTVIDLAWKVFEGATDSLARPYPFDGLRLDGERSDGSAITIEALKLRK